MILHDLGAIYCLVMNFFRSCPTTEMTLVDRVLSEIVKKWNPDIKFPYLIHFCGPVQLVVRFWPNEAMSVECVRLYSNS